MCGGRIARLEEKVKTLKAQNSELASTANMLREQVAQLKQKVMNY
nr:rJunLZ [synthetic construct]